ncbi:MAG TPA: hypothetical protein VE975_07770, partial [Actinomycetota bacterium]|nr:hypothetical protein [Actinomycetota bacterium]
ETRVGPGGNRCRGAGQCRTTANAVAHGSRSSPLLAIAWFITWFGPSIYGIAFVSIRQSVTPDHLQGRQNATTRFMVWGAMCLGSLAVGGIAELAGGRFAVATMAIAAALCIIPLVKSREVRKLRNLES